MRCAPQSAWISVAGTPHTFSVYVLKKCGTAASRSARRSALERVLVLRRADRAPRGRTPTQRIASIEAEVRAARSSARAGSRRACRGSRCGSCAGRQQEVLVAAGSRTTASSTSVHLGEEAVAADVEAPAVALDGAADAADDRVGLEDRRRPRRRLHQLVGGGQAGGAGPDDDHVVRRRTDASCVESVETAFVEGMRSPCTRPSPWAVGADSRSTLPRPHGTAAT